MGRYVRLWILLFLAFTLVFAVCVNHDMLVLKNDHEIWIKGKATRSEIAIGSTLIGFILSSITTSLHVLIEGFVAPLPGQTRTPNSEETGK